MVICGAFFISDRFYIFKPVPLCRYEINITQMCDEYIEISLHSISARSVGCSVTDLSRVSGILTNKASHKPHYSSPTRPLNGILQPAVPSHRFRVPGYFRCGRIKWNVRVSSFARLRVVQRRPRRRSIG